MESFVFGNIENETSMTTSFTEFKFLGDEIVVMSELEHDRGGCEKFNFFHSVLDIEGPEDKPFFPQIYDLTKDIKSRGVTVCMEGTNTDVIIEELQKYEAENRDYWGLVAGGMIRYLEEKRDIRQMVIGSYVDNKSRELPEEIVVDDFFNHDKS